MKSIKIKLLLVFTALILAMNVGVGLVTRTIVSDQLVSDAHEHLTEMAQFESKHLQAVVEGELNYISSIAQNPIMLSEEITFEEKVAFFEKEAKRTGFLAYAFADKEGNSTVFNAQRQTTNVANRDYFQSALSGKPTVSDLLISSATGELVMIFASPIYKGDQIAGVIYGRKDGGFLSQVVSDVKYKKTGYAYMINNDGVTVGHKNTDLVYAQDNDIINMETDESLRELGELTLQMTSRNPGSGEYTYNKITKIAGYAPVENTPWILIFGIEKEEILAGLSNLYTTLLIIFAASTIIGILVVFFFSNSISSPIKKVTHAAKRIADGDFDVVLAMKSKDEVGQLGRAFNLTLERLVNYKGYIDEISAALMSISEGNLQIVLERKYEGQFRKIKDNLENLLDGLSSTLLEINQASDQVNNGAEQVAHGALNLSQGATQQASSIEELSATIEEVALQIKQNAENADVARSKAEVAGAELKSNDGEMQNMILAMEQINNKATEISKIIKVIEDIAFQTNILALNAAIEAARAGAAGKGFAVVADEVRNLAAKSAEAANDTAQLIQETVESINSGSAIAGKTAESLARSSDGTIAAISLIAGIAAASKAQAVTIEEINQGIDQISTVVQTNAATAEESAAASEELSGQSNLLRQAVSKFRLRESAKPSYYFGHDETNESLPPSRDEAPLIALNSGKY